MPMSESLLTMDRDDLETSLARSFTEGIDWPPDAASRAALLDMGLTANQLAQYFRVDLNEVNKVFGRSRRAARR
jgi:hypothetical protein